VRALFSTPDIAPTLIDAAGLPVPGEMEGRSLMPVVRDARAEWRDDLLVQISETETGRALRTHRRKYGVTAAYDHAAPAAAYREACLYDLDADPWEMVNLVGMEPFDAVVAGLRARLLGWIARVEDGATPEIVPAPRQVAASSGSTSGC